MRPAARRVWGLMYRHLALYRHSWPRVLELAYWPILQILLWGFTSRWLAERGALGPDAGTGALIGGALIGGVLLWEVALRAQMGFSLTFLEEIWSRNLGHLFVSPLRPREMLAALMAMSMLRTLVALIPAAALAWLLYGFDVLALGPVLVLFFAALMLMGWAISLAVVAMILRHGAGAESLAWSLLFGLAPFAAVFYPVSALPEWVRPLSWALPATHVFEGMRAALLDGHIAWGHLAAAFGLDALWLAAMGWVFLDQFRRARASGALVSIGE
ncbi:ABC transporter permease [Roseomonas gilardii]|uniref:ABC transporter permease n=1 Tax=Roseomonas gilardii TaxID=257708 RepID=UPI0011A8F664|nr:ABC transporter permease [Roseomonas gilardii]